MIELSIEDMEHKYVYAIELLLWSSTHGSEVKYDYCTYYYNQCNIQNPRKLHLWLYENGYLRAATLEESLMCYTTVWLKNLADVYNCKKSGKKADIIHRIILNMSDADKIKYTNRSLLFMTQKGLNFYTNNYDLVKLHLHGKIPFAEYLPYRSSSCFEENVIRLYQDKLKSYMSQYHYSGVSFCYQEFHQLYAALNESELAMLYLLYSLYYSVNCTDSYSFYFDPENIKFYGIASMKKRLLESSNILFPYQCKEINSYSKYYTESMVDEIYQNAVLPCQLMNPKTFKRMINDVITNISVDRNRYLAIIADNYVRLIKNSKNPKQPHQSLAQKVLSIVQKYI